MTSSCTSTLTFGQYQLSIVLGYYLIVQYIHDIWRDLGIIRSDLNKNTILPINIDPENSQSWTDVESSLPKPYLAGLSIWGWY